MAKPRDLDLFARSLKGGDWKSRVEFFKKFILGSSRVRSLGAAYQDLDDFLHDCLTNVLRTGHSFNAEQDLGEWVESVAAWTALDRQRLRYDGAPDAARPVRLCAAVEGDEAKNRGRMASYVPPRSGPEDSPVSRIAALVGQQQFIVLSKRAIDNSSWEDTATAAGQPLNTICPVLVRTVDRLARFFGAPPPLNADLEPVFSWTVRKSASRANPEKPKGRIISMQLDPSFYSLTPEMRKIGLSVPGEVRTIVLWDAARASTAPNEALRDHLAQCHYCAEVLRAMLLMQEALQSSPGAEFLLCPGGFTLWNTLDGTYKTFDQHLAECAACRAERDRLLSGAERRSASGSQNSVASPRRKIAWAGAGAALLLVGIGGGYYAQRQYFPAKSEESAQPVAQNIPDMPVRTVAIDARYKDLAQQIDITDAKWLASVLPKNRHEFALMIEQLQAGRVSEAKIIASGLGEKDPGVQMLYSVILYQNSVSDGFGAMLKAEAMPPRNSFRCWALLQAALIVGEMKVIEREVEHLSSDPEYAARAKALLERARARK